jgi:hypothetical protein
MAIRRLSTREKVRVLVLSVVAAAMLAGLAVGTNWRLAVVAGLTAGAIALTRLRYASVVAVAVLAIMVVLAQTGHSAGGDHRDRPARSSDR